MILFAFPAKTADKHKWFRMRISELKFGLNRPYEVAAQCDTGYLKTPSESKKIGCAKDKSQQPNPKTGRLEEGGGKRWEGGGWRVDGGGSRVEGGGWMVEGELG